MKKTSSFILLLMLIIDFACFAQGKTLKITHPNGGEKIIAGSNTAITWEGCDMTDTVTLEYSTDRGRSWQNITDAATGYKYNWEYVNVDYSQECLVRAKLIIKPEKVKEPLVLGLGTLESIAVNPINPNIIATAGGRGLVFIWDMSKGKIIDTVADAGISFKCISFSPDGQNIASGCWDNLIRVWDIKTRKCTGTFTNSYLGTDYISYSPDGRKIAFVSGDNNIRVCDTESGYTLCVTRCSRNLNTPLSFSPDSKKFVSIGYNGEILISNAETGEWPDTLKGSYWGVSSVIFSPDGKSIASAGQDRVIRLWDVETYTCIDSINEPDFIYSIGFSPDGKKIVSGNYDNIARIWDLDTKKCLFTLSGHNDAVTYVAFSSDGQRIISRSNDQFIYVWDALTGKCLDTLSGHTNPIRSISFSGDGRSIAGCGYDKTVRIWDTQTGQCRKVLMGHEEILYAVSFSAVGKKLLSGSLKEIMCWDESTGDNIYQIEAPGEILECNPMQENFISSLSYPAGYLLIRDINTGVILDTLKGHIDYINEVSFSRDGQKMASNGAMDHTVRIWDLIEKKNTLTLPFCLFSLSLSPDGQKIATGGNSFGKIYLWDTGSGLCFDTLNNFNDTISTQVRISYSPDEKMIASTGHYDNGIRVMQISTETFLDTLAGHLDLGTVLKYSPDGKLIASGSMDGTVRLWDVDNINTVIIDTSDSLFSIVDPSSVNDNQQIEKRLSVLPNPANNILTISFGADKASVSSIYICNILGQKLKEINPDVEPGQHTSQVDISSLPAGTYYVVLQGLRGCEVKKLQVIR